ncbi:MAG: pyridoxal phosphate-dependent aminotransferase [Alphaproteobacteria bacterium]|nr:pyridoxal phosphate-dependent aminotransferase [Alphaproteobacteria bacterium]
MIQLAEGMGRLGTETAFEVLARAEALKQQGKDIINLGIGQPDFRTPDHIVEAAAKALRDGQHGYTAANGILPLREAIAGEWAKRYKATVDPGRILVVPGGKVTMFFAIAMLGEKGAEIIYPNPGFPIYESVIRWTGATPVALPLLEKNGFAFRAEDVLSRITPRTRLIIINSPANPTGGVTPRGEIDKLAKGLEKHPDVVLMSDEIYGRIVYDKNEHVSLLEYENLRNRLILLDGFSKTYAMTGWRVGYALWPKDMIEGATRLAVNCHSCVNAASQWAGIAALQGPQDAVDRMVKAFDERRRYIVGALNQTPGLRCVEPGGAFYAFPNIEGTGMTAKAAQTKFLEEAGVATVAGTSFGAHGEGYIRFSYANSLDNIKEAIRRLGACLNGR